MRVLTLKPFDRQVPSFVCGQLVQSPSIGASSPPCSSGVHLCGVLQKLSNPAALTMSFTSK